VARAGAAGLRGGSRVADADGRLASPKRQFALAAPARLRRLRRLAICVRCSKGGKECAGDATLETLGRRRRSCGGACTARRRRTPTTISPPSCRSGEALPLASAGRAPLPVRTDGEGSTSARRLSFSRPHGVYLGKGRPALLSGSTRTGPSRSGLGVVPAPAYGNPDERDTLRCSRSATRIEQSRSAGSKATERGTKFARRLRILILPTLQNVSNRPRNRVNERMPGKTARAN